MASIKSTLAKLKNHPGQAGDNDDHKYKRTYSLDVKLSPIEVQAFRNFWAKSEFNSMAAFARYKMFGGNEHTIDLYFPQKQEEKISAMKLLSELNREGKNLNQITKKLSSKEYLLNQEVQLALKDLSKALKNIEEIKEKFFSPKNK
jgi:hypothetical protein